jgi:hypothetical protein
MHGPTCIFWASLTPFSLQGSFLGKCYGFYVIYHLLLSTTLLGWLAMNVTVDKSLPGGRRKLYVESIGMFHQVRKTPSWPRS